MNLLFVFGRRFAVATLLLLTLIAYAVPAAIFAQSAAGINSPATGAAVNGAVPIIGTADIDNFQRYELYYKQEPNGDDSYIYFDGNTRQVQNAQLGVWQTGGLTAGTYTIRMRVVKADGNYSEHFVRNLSVNQQSAETETPTPTSTSTPTPTSDQPTATATPFQTPIPIGTVVQPTPIVVQVQQPDLSASPAAVAPTPTTALVALGSAPGTDAGSTVIDPQSPNVVSDAAAPAVAVESGNNFTQELGAALALDQLRERFFTGVRYSAGIFILIIAIFAGKRFFEWMLSRAG